MFSLKPCVETALHESTKNCSKNMDAIAPGMGHSACLISSHLLTIL